MNINKVIAHKEELGFHSGGDNVAYVERTSKLGAFAYTATLLQETTFIISFEETGILFMGISKLFNFTNTDHFLPLADFSQVAFAKSKFINGRLVFNGEKMTLTNNEGKADHFMIYTMLVGSPWVKSNLPNVKRIASAYPSLAEKMAKHQAGNTSSTDVAAPASLGDQLRDLKDLVDQGILTTDEFEAKKKQLLGL